MQSIKERNRRRTGGFTLVELLVVIVVLAVLAAIVLPKFMDSGQRSKESALKSDLKLVRNAISLFKTDTGLYPITLANLSDSVAPSQGHNGTAEVDLTATNWHGPYLQSVANDPVSGAALTYDKTKGAVTSSATGNGLDGSAYNTW